MPIWASVTIAVLSGIGVGLLGTVIKLIEERGAPVRQATLDSGLEFAALASDWFDAVAKAIDNCRVEYADWDEERAAANRLLLEGRKRLDRLAVIVGPGSAVVAEGAHTLNSLDWAVKVLPTSLDDVMDSVAEDGEEADDDEPSDEEEFAALVGDDWDGRVDAACVYLDNGLEHWGRFTYEASKYFHRGLFHRQRPAPRPGVDDARRAPRR